MSVEKVYVCEWDIPPQAWEKFVDDAFNFGDGDQNFRYDFKTVSKKYGRQFMEFCRAAWIGCSEFMTAEEFCSINANMPIGFFRAKIDIF